MSNQDPIANMLCSIKNAVAHDQAHFLCLQVKKKHFTCAQKQGFIDHFETQGEVPHKVIQISLRYNEFGQCTINNLVRVSKPSRRITSKSNDIPRVQGGMVCNSSY